MLFRSRRGLMVVGGLRRASEQAAALAWATKLGWPVFADVTSGLRQLPVVPLLDQLLLSPRFAAAEAPDVVIQVGGAVTSKRLWRWLADARPAWLQVRPDGERRDPVHGVTERWAADLAAVAAAWSHPAEAPTRLQRWDAASRELETRIAHQVADWNVISEIGVARAVASHLPESHALVLASSMPVRDMDQFAPAWKSPRRVLAQRGVSGIDGTLAHAAGIALQHGPTTLILGDQAFAHDVGSLQVLAASGAPLTVVLVDNRGGGIFHFLPVAAEQDIFERHFAAPGVLDPGLACAAVGVPHEVVSGPLEPFLQEAWAQQRPRVLHVRTNRERNVEQHQLLQGMLRAEVERRWTE